MFYVTSQQCSLANSQTNIHVRVLFFHSSLFAEHLFEKSTTAETTQHNKQHHTRKKKKQNNHFQTGGNSISKSHCDICIISRVRLLPTQNTRHTRPLHVQSGAIDALCPFPTSERFSISKSQLIYCFFSRTPSKSSASARHLYIIGNSQRALVAVSCTTITKSEVNSSIQFPQPYHQ